MLLAFEASEAERKMRDAIARLDLEAAIPLRDEWRRLRAECQAAEREVAQGDLDRRVIDFATRQPVPCEPPSPTLIDLVDAEMEEPGAAPFTADPEEVTLLSFIADEVAAGRLSGLVIFAGHREEDGTIDVVSSWNTSPAWDNLQKFMGAFAECQHDLLAVSGDLYEATDE